MMLAVLLLTLVALAQPAHPHVAGAQDTPGPGSIVYISEHDVWLAAPDGSRRRRLTVDGSATEPYHDPSQAGDGSIAVLKGADMVHRLGRDGGALAAPIRLITLEHGAEGLVISPKGDRLAYATTGTGVEVDPRFGTPTGIFLYGGTDVAALDGVPVEGAVAPSMIFPDWVDDDRLVVTDGVELYTYRPGRDGPDSWVSFTDGCVTDFDCPPAQGAYATISQPVVSQDGRWLAYAYQPFFGSPGRRIASLAAPPPAPATTACLLPGQETSLNPLTFSPDGSMVAYDDTLFDPATLEATTGAGIHVLELDPQAPDCGLSAATLVLPGGSQPEWGPSPP